MKRPYHLLFLLIVLLGLLWIHNHDEPIVEAGGAPPSSLSWSPDSTQIAFAQDGYNGADIYLTDADGGNIRNITNGERGIVWEVAWSPAGDELAFLQQVYTSRELFFYDLASGEFEQPYTFETHVDTTIWSPDATHFVAHFYYVGYMIDFAQETIEIFTPPDTNSRFLGWSPDGTHFAFVHRPDSGENQHFTITVGSLDGTSQNITTAEIEPRGFLAWSPDSQRVAFTAGDIGTDDPDLDIFIANLATGDLTHLAQPITDEYVTAWLPNDELIFVAGQGDGSPQSISILPIDDPESSRMLYCGEWGLDSLDLSPDGKNLVFGAAGGVNLFISLADGATSQIVAQGRYVWSPDSSRIAFYGGSIEQLHIVNVLDPAEGVFTDPPPNNVTCE